MKQKFKLNSIEENPESLDRILAKVTISQQAICTSIDQIMYVNFNILVLSSQFIIIYSF